MDKKVTLAAVILTKNESMHIKRCLDSLKGIIDDIVIVDCFSTDDTKDLAESFGARVIQHQLKYVKAPLFIRPFANFFYRYIIKAGFLDGKEGFLWHFLQGFWYRMLVDAKVYEIKKISGLTKN